MKNTLKKVNCRIPMGGKGVYSGTEELRLVKEILAGDVLPGVIKRKEENAHVMKYTPTTKRRY